MNEYFLTMPHDSETEPTMASMQESDPDALAAVIAAVEEFNTALRESGVWRYAGGLHPPSTAKTVDASSGDVRVLDEPFVQAPAYVGGFWVIEAPDEATAIEWAARASRAVQSPVEVRALQ